MASHSEYPGINAYLQLVQERLANNPDYVKLFVHLSQMHTYVTIAGTNGLQTSLLRDRFIAVMEEANRMRATIEADQPVRDADPAFRAEMATLLGQQSIRESEARARAEAEANRTAAGRILLTVGAVVVGPALAVGAVAGGPALAVGTAVIAPALAVGAVVAGPALAIGTAVVGPALAAGAAVAGPALAVGTAVVGPALAAGTAVANPALAVGAAVVGPALDVGAAAVGPALTAGALKLAGSSSIGPLASSLAATIQSICYKVGSGSLLAPRQSAAMEGIVVGNAAEIAAGVAALGVGAGLMSGSDGSNHSDVDAAGSKH
ncbi:hypothetical protein FRC01_002295 [Tulasnella sp. 417]|nr:hypothetical protein FRC01_002295 [Tulasnella sp. 417]